MNKQNKISSENIELLKQVNSIINSFDKSIIDSWDLFRISKSAMLNGLYPIASCTIEKIIPDVIKYKINIYTYTYIYIYV